MQHSTFRLAVGIPTCGRPALAGHAARALSRQTRAPDRILVCATGPGDVDTLPPGAELLICAPGLPRQRNAILDRLADCDAVLFLDDDFAMHPGYLEATCAALQDNPHLAGVTGSLAADGTRGPGIALADAERTLAASPARLGDGFQAVGHLYGCNMAIRLATIRQHGLRFDECLPLYAWSEDVDFTHRLRRHGMLAQLHGALGIHLGSKQGRTPGCRLGYSQVANPIYLFRKGSYTLLHALRSIGRNLAANAARSPRPEPYVDRRGRLHGNGLAMWDLLRGRLHPARVLDL